MKNNGKKILLVTASIFLIWQSFLLIAGLPTLGQPGLGVILFISFLLNLYITGIFAFAGFALPTQKLMPTSYYQVNNPRRLKKVYNLLNVELFRKFLLATFWRNKKQQKKYFDGTREGIRHLEVQSMKSEFGHLIPAVVILTLVIYMFILGQYILGLVTLLINVIGNVYPVILQRYHRMRIARFRKFFDNRNAV